MHMESIESRIVIVTYYRRLLPTKIRPFTLHIPWLFPSTAHSQDSAHVHLDALHQVASFTAESDPCL